MARSPLSAVLLPAILLVLVSFAASRVHAGEPLYGSAGPPVVEGYTEGSVEEFIPGGYETATAVPAGEQLYPCDAPEPWMHGYFQELPAYGGHATFHPDNYKDVLSQSQVAGGWGMSPRMPYSQQFWHRYHDRATMQARMSSGNSASDPAGSVNRDYPATRFSNRNSGGITPTQNRSTRSGARRERPTRRRTGPGAAGRY